MTKGRFRIGLLTVILLAVVMAIGGLVFIGINYQLQHLDAPQLEQQRQPQRE